MPPAPTWPATAGGPVEALTSQLLSEGVVVDPMGDRAAFRGGGDLFVGELPDLEEVDLALEA